jgi:hypothetical protein
LCYLVKSTCQRSQVHLVHLIKFGRSRGQCVKRFMLMQELKTTIAGGSVSVEPRQFVPIIRSGSFADIGPRRYMEDEHIRIDDLSGHLGSLLMPSAFYGVCTVDSVWRFCL